MTVHPTAIKIVHLLRKDLGPNLLPHHITSIQEAVDASLLTAEQCSAAADCVARQAGKLRVEAADAHDAGRKEDCTDLLISAISWELIRDKLRKMAQDLT